MKHIVTVVRDILPSVQGKLLSDAEYFQYLKENPQLYSLVSAALHEGDVTEGNLLINHPSFFETKVPKVADVGLLVDEVVVQIRFFATWLVTAGAMLKFTVLGNASGALKAKPARKKKTAVVRPKSPRGVIISCDQIPKRHKALRKLCRKIGGFEETKHYIQHAYDTRKSQRKLAKALSRQFHMRISQDQITNWMRLLHLTCRPQVGGKQLRLSKGNLKADQILRRKRGVGLVLFLRQGRSQNKNWEHLAEDIQKITRVVVYPYSLNRLARRAKIR